MSAPAGDEYGTLIDYRTADEIRPATRDEYDRSVEAARRDGGAGVIDVDGRDVYVSGEPL